MYVVFDRFNGLMYDVDFSRCFEKPIELVKFFRALLGFWDSMTTALRMVED